MIRWFRSTLAQPSYVECSIVQPESEFEHRGAGVPSVRPSLGPSHGVRSKGHVCHGDLGHVGGRVLSNGKSACGGSLASDDVDDGLATALAGISCPKQRIHLVFHERGYLRGARDDSWTQRTDLSTVNEEPSNCPPPIWTTTNGFPVVPS